MIVKHTIGIVLLLGTFIYISTFFIVYEFELLTTYIGIIVVLLSIVLGIAFQSQLIGIILPNADVLASTSRHLEQSLLYQSRLKYIHKTGMNIYYILLSLGLALYIYEFANRNLWFGITAYALTGGWVLFSWFYLRKRSIKKQQQKIDEQIEALRHVQKSFGGDEATQ